MNLVLVRAEVSNSDFAVPMRTTHWFRFENMGLGLSFLQENAA